MAKTFSSRDAELAELSTEQLKALEWLEQMVAVTDANLEVIQHQLAGVVMLTSTNFTAIKNIADCRDTLLQMEHHLEVLRPTYLTAA